MGKTDTDLFVFKSLKRKQKPKQNKKHYISAEIEHNCPKCGVWSSFSSSGEDQGVVPFPSYRKS